MVIQKIGAKILLMSFLSLSLGAQILRFKTSPSSLTELIEINVEYFPNLQFLGKVAH